MLAEMFQNDQTVKIGLWLIMTFKDLVAPKGAVFVFHRTQRLQGRLTIWLLIITWSAEFRAGSQKLLCHLIVIWSPFSYWSHRLKIFACRCWYVHCWSLQSLCSNAPKPFGFGGLWGFVKKLDQHVDGKLTFSLRWKGGEYIYIKI